MEYHLGLNSETNFNFKLFSEFSGVGMIRGENLCIAKMQYFLNPEFCNYVTEYLQYVSKVFENKNVWYRTADLVPHQINVLDGCDMYIEESQYLIGNRGIRRNLQFYNTYLLELKAFLNAYKEHNNLGILIPFISNINEVSIGDIIQLSFDGNIFGHSLIVVDAYVKNRKNNIFVATHTDDSYYRDLSTYNFRDIRFIKIEGVRSY